MKRLIKRKQEQHFLCLVMVSALAAGLAQSAQGSPNLLQNGDFSTYVPVNSTGGGWTSENSDGSGGWFDIGGTHGGTFRLNEAGQYNSDPTLSQFVSNLTVGDTYNVTGEYTSWYIGYSSTVDGFGVAIDNNWLSTAPATSGWKTFSFDFVAAANGVTLSLAGERNSTDNDFAIDNISFTKVSNGVPETSSTFTLLAFGVMGLSLARRRLLTSRCG